MISKTEQKERLKINMRRFFFTKAGIENCLTTATSKNIEFLDNLLFSEVERREVTKKSSAIKGAGFSTLKNIDDFKFDYVTMPNSLTKEEMFNLDFITNRESLILQGVCGSGKTMLSICLGISACNKGYKVKSITLSELALKLKHAAAEGRLDYCLKAYQKLDLLIIDEWGYCHLDKESSEYIFRVISDSYENKSLIITTNLPFSEWGKIVADEQLAAAMIDRIIHYGHYIDTGTVDWRILNSPMNKQAIVNKGI